jgi:hypothetical protein
MIALALLAVTLGLSSTLGQEPRSTLGQEPRSTLGQEPSGVGTPPKQDAEELAARAGADAIAEPEAAPSWRDLLSRDSRLSFSLRSATDASAALDRTDGTALRRAGAWMALGCAGSAGDRARIVKQARIGKGLERRAAILALGEMAADEEGLLSWLAGDVDAQAAECALLALLRSHRPGGRDRVQASARDASDPRSAVALGLLAFDRDPATSPPPRAVRTLIELRWEAASAFGMVDRASFAARRVDELASSPAFVSVVVLRAAARSPSGAVKDHLLSALVEGQGPGRLTAAIDAIPRQISQLVDSGLWTPRDPGEWATILEEIEREHVEALTSELLAQAEEKPGLRWRARALMEPSDRGGLVSFTAADLAGLEAGDRALACQVLGSTVDPDPRILLTALVGDVDVRVRGAARVAELRLGGKSAAPEMDKILPDRSHPEHVAVLESLCRNARDPAVAIRLEGFLRTAAGADLAAVAAALCVHGRASGRETVRSLLCLDSPPTGARRLMLVRALSRRPGGKDRQVLSELFPQAGEEALNLELAVGLASLSDPAVRPILRAALWRGGFDESVLAGILLAEANGARFLIEEILRPPREADSADLRRVGFALGEWGGVAALTALAREAVSAAGPEMQGALLGALSSRTQ